MKRFCINLLATIAMLPCFFVASLAYQEHYHKPVEAKPVVLIPPTQEPDMEPLPVQTVSKPLMAALRQTESGGNARAVSKKGAVGECQMLPATMREMHVNPRTRKNCEAAERYLKKLADHYGDQVLALAAYNWGIGNVDRWLAKGGEWSKLPEETRNYISRVKVREAVNTYQLAED